MSGGFSEGINIPRKSAYYRETGKGPSVICLHSVASSGLQWRPLMNCLAESYRVIAIDFYGDGKSPPCRDDRDFSIDDEIGLIEPILEEAGPFHLVGHSYGGYVAVKICLSRPDRVASLVLYEPALWGTLVNSWPDDPSTREILTLRSETGRLIESGDTEAAAQRFIDYWAGEGSWKAIPDSRHDAIIAGIVTGDHKWKASPGPSISPEELNALEVPTLVMTGSETAATMRGLISRLRQTLPRWRFVELEGLGHMGPITHAEIVNGTIADFLKSLR
jgi:pimeloyl-ACP methyl ester carboxylesterase